MLDINLFRLDKGGDPDKVRQSQRRRYADVTLVDQVIDADQKWRRAQNHMETLKMQRSTISKQIATYKKSQQDVSDLLKESTALKRLVEEAEQIASNLEQTRDKSLLLIGNIVDDSVPVSDDEVDNTIIKTSGIKRRLEEGLRNHVDLVHMLDIVDMDNGVVVAGGRGYYLKNEGVLLNQALIQLALHSAYQRGYCPVMPPFFMRRTIMAECAQLAQFDDELYSVTGEGEDKYMTATSEQPLCALHRKQWFEEKDLPLKYVGISTCFRKEAGSHGRDQLGIFRTHQFEKVEQFVTTPHLITTRLGSTSRKC